MAREGAAKEAMILTRSVLNMALRAAYLTLPEEEGERRRRYIQLYVRGVEDAQKISDRGEEQGFDPLDLSDARAERELALDELRKIESKRAGRKTVSVADGRGLFRICGLDTFYSGIYMPMSDVVHFGIGPALDEVHAETVDLDATDPDRSEVALSAAVIVFGFLIHASERSLGHSLGMEAHRIVVAGQKSRGEETVRPVNPKG